MLILIPPVFNMSDDSNEVGPHFFEHNHPLSPSTSSSGGIAAAAAAASTTATTAGGRSGGGRIRGRKNGPPKPLSLTNRVPFPMKLFQMLEDTERDGHKWICSWSADGTCFKVHNTHAFVDKVMPIYFRQTRYKSFQRQCHLYGYVRLSSGPNKGHYAHPKFIKNNRDLCRQMMPLRRLEMEQQQHQQDHQESHRNVGTKKTQRQRGASKTTMGHGTSSELGPGEGYGVYPFSSSALSSSSSSSRPMLSGGTQVYPPELQILPPKIDFDDRDRSIDLSQVFSIASAHQAMATPTNATAGLPAGPSTTLQHLDGSTGFPGNFDPSTLDSQPMLGQSNSRTQLLPQTAMVPAVGQSDLTVSSNMMSRPYNLQILHANNNPMATIHPRVVPRSNMSALSSGASGDETKDPSSPFSLPYRQQSQQQPIGIPGLFNASQLLGYEVGSIQMNVLSSSVHQFQWEQQQQQQQQQHQQQQHQQQQHQQQRPKDTNTGEAGDTSAQSNTLASFASALTNHEFPDGFDFDALEPRPFR
mmetsp:Transcript_58013/g.141755  ORF Transcript_58013/g.141755 Transcript_58013/m.141755 type:complete len:528 (-) Transcript_58013:61-1644(-)